jgi:hypothetical protein
MLRGMSMHRRQSEEDYRALGAVGGPWRRFGVS